MTKNFPELTIHNKLQIQEVQKQNTQKSTPQHIIFKFQKIKDKEKTLKIDRSLQGAGGLRYRGARIRITYDFFPETIQARKWTEILKCPRKKLPV